MLSKLFNKITGNRFLVQPWVLDIDLLQQSSLISVLRGDDSVNGTNVKSKSVTKMLRYLIVNNIGKKDSYMSDHVMTGGEVMLHLLKSRDNNRHWVDHIIAAAFIIKKTHPNNYTRKYWGHIADGYVYRVKAYKKKQAAIAKERDRVQSIIDKYVDIYTTRYV